MGFKCICILHTNQEKTLTKAHRAPHSANDANVNKIFFNKIRLVHQKTIDISVMQRFHFLHTRYEYEIQVNKALTLQLSHCFSIQMRTAYKGNSELILTNTLRCT